MKLSMDALGRDSVEEFKDKDKNPFCFVLDNIRSLHNVGSAFRTADSFAAEKIWLCGITGTPPNREINKTALGATESVEWEHQPNTIDVINQLKNEGWTIVAVEQTSNSTLLQNWEVDKQKYAFVFGNEVDGVDEEVIKAADLVLEIPQFGTKHSLNVSVTMGIVSWQFIQVIGEK